MLILAGVQVLLFLSLFRSQNSTPERGYAALDKKPEIRQLAAPNTEELPRCVAIRASQITALSLAGEMRYTEGEHGNLLA